MTRPAPRKSSLAGASTVVPPRKSSLAGASPVAPPRKSSLAGASPVAPPREVAPTEAAPAVPPAPAAVPAEHKTKYPPKVSFYQDPEDTARVRGAILHTMTTEGSRNLSQFINQAVMSEVERLEAKYNGGQPFPSVGVRELPQGRPMEL